MQSIEYKVWSDKEKMKLKINSFQRRKNPVKHIRWSFLVKIVNGF